MKNNSVFLIASAALVASMVTGCGGSKANAPGSLGSGEDATVAQGTILFVEYRKGDDTTGGFTRINHPDAVPAGNGSWNVDAVGHLTRDFLIVTRPQRPDLGPLVIPTNRLIEVQFGDGGIRSVAESKTSTGEFLQIAE